MVQVPGGDDCPLTGATEATTQATAASPATVIKAGCDAANDFLSTAISPESFLKAKNNFAESCAKDKKELRRISAEVPTEIPAMTSQLG